MNLDELKPQWESYKSVIGKECELTDQELSDLIAEKTVPYPWYTPSHRTFLNACVSLLLMGITGC